MSPLNRSLATQIIKAVAIVGTIGVIIGAIAVSRQVSDLPYYAKIANKQTVTVKVDSVAPSNPQ